MENIFRKLQQGATNAAGKFLETFDRNKDTAAGKTAKSVGDFFTPTPQVRARDVVRESPNALADVIGRPMLRSFAALGKKIGSGDIRATYEPKTAFEKDMFGTDQGINFSTIGKEVRMAKPDSKTIPVLDPTVGAIIASLDAPTGGRVGQAVKAGVKGTATAFEGAKNLTTKVLDGLQGKTTVNRQFIEDLVKRPDVKQAERDVVNAVLKEQPEGKIEVQGFADAVEERLLPVTVRNKETTTETFKTLDEKGYDVMVDPDGDASIYRKTPNGDIEDIAYEELPEDIQSLVRELGDYRIRHENVTLPDDIRGPVANYDERVWQSPIKTRAGNIHFEGATNNYFAHTRVEDLPDETTRRVIELQSDLFQRGRLADESYVMPRDYPSSPITKATPGSERATEVAKLEPFRNTWWQRVAREEVRAAARDGKKELLFPTGKTAMQVEGLGQGGRDFVTPIRGRDTQVTPSNIETGSIIRNEYDEYVILETLENGRAKVVPRYEIEAFASDLKKGDVLIEDLDSGELTNILKKWRAEATPGDLGMVETFDFSGTIDTSNPIFKFYETDLAKYLKNRYGADRFTDERGVEWMRVKVRPETANQPVEAFAGIAAGVETDEEGDPTGFNPLAGLMGAGAFALARGNRGAKPGVGHIAKVLREVDESSVLLERAKGEPPVTMLKMPQDPTAVFYHGTSKADAESILRTGWNPSRSVKESKEAPTALFAGDLTEAGMYGDTLLEIRPAKGAKIKTLSTSDQEWGNMVQRTGGGASKEMHQAARAAGYDAIYVGDEIEILNPGKFEIAVKGAKNTMRSVGDIIGGPRPPEPRRTDIRPKRDERRFTTRTRALEPGTDQFLDGAKTTRNTDELITKADELIESDLVRAEGLAKSGTDDLAVAVASRLIDQYVNLATKATKATEKEAYWQKAAEISNHAARNLTDAGRAVQAAAILGRNTPEGMVRFAAKFIQNHNDTVDRMNSPVNRTIGGIFGTQEGKQLQRIPNLTAEQAEQIVTRMKEIDNIPDPEVKSIALQELMDTVIKPLVPDSLYKKIYTVWKAGLLTGIKTTGLNIGSNIAHFTSEITKDVPAALVDRIVSIFTGKRTTAMTLRGMPSGMREGVARGWTYFKTGYDARDVGGKLDYRRVHMGNSKLAKAIQLYEETVFKTHGTQDQPFYYGAKARSLYSQAIAQSKNKGLRGQAAADFVNELVANPTDDMLKYATLDAETVVFQNRTTLGDAARKIQDIPGGQFLLPFGKTPSAVATQIINYTPVGAVATIARSIGKGKFDQRLFSQQMGRAITGTGAIYLGTQLYKQGMMNLNMPTSEREREQWRMEGRVPNSIQMADDRWRNPIVLGPAGLLLILGGQVQRGIDETGSFVGGMSMAAPGMVGTMTEQTFLSGINAALDAVKDPERSWQGYSSSLAGSIVPTIVGDLARGLDDYERDAPTPSTRIQSRIPGLRQNTEPRVNPFGEKTETPDFFEVMADSTRPGVPNVKPEDQRLVRELRRLADSGFIATPTALVPRAGYDSLTPEENTTLRGYSGQAVKRALEETMQSPNYLRMDDEMRADAIDKAVRNAKVEARAYMVQSLTRGLSEGERNQRLAELKEDGILTQQVYNRYLQINR